VISFYVV